MGKNLGIFYQEQDEAAKDYICSVSDNSGMHKCEDLPPFESGGFECNNTIEGFARGISGCINWHRYFTDCKQGENNPFSGAISFDNIGLAWVAIFLVCNHANFLLHLKKLMPHA